MNTNRQYRLLARPAAVKISVKEYIQKHLASYSPLAAKNNNQPVPRPTVPNAKLIKLSPPGYS